MSSARRVPETRLLGQGELSADHAWRALRRYGGWRLLRDALVRFRYGDGFSHSRALALQLVLSLIPLGIAFIGLSSTLRAESIGQVMREVLLRVTPGSTDELVRQTIERGEANVGHGELALYAGLAAAVVALTASMGQVERGANRIYGIQRDRPALHKYGRAALLAVSAGIMSLTGFVVFVAGGIVGRALQRTYGWSDEQLTVWNVVRFPIGALLALTAFTLLLEHAPRRQQPGWSWISIGAGVAVTLWVLFTYLLSLYVQTSGSFGSTYGPLTGIIALLIWAQLTSIALFLGIAFCAQLEAVRAGVHDPERGDPEAVG
jgi:YihY family inner membrane protein